MEINTESNAHLNVVLLGKTRAGISASGNTILGKKAFISKKSSKSVTRDVAVESGKCGTLPVTVYDTPGLFNTDMNEDEIQQIINEKVLQKCESGPCVFLLVIKADSFTEEERETVEKIEKLLGEKQLRNTWILFTKGDELVEENMTIQEFINESEQLKKLVQKYDQRYHVFNNKKRENEDPQVKMLLVKILKPYFDIQEETLQKILKQNPQKKIPKDFINQDKSEEVSSLPSRRIVLLGKSGMGKSAAGNTILGQKEFKSVTSMSSVTSECSEAHVTVSGRSVSVVDTPGFFDTKMKPENLAEEIARSVYLSSPGPHAFLIVFPVNMRYTEQEQQIPQQIEMMFGQEVLKYSIILFTHGDQLDGESVEELIKENNRLRDLVQQCGGRFHVFNNRDQNNREQVNDLLQKIDTMIEKNGGGYYSNQMFEDAQRYRREEEERKLREEEKREDKGKGKKEGGFMQFFRKHQHYFYIAAVVAGIAVGGIAGGVLAEAVLGGAVVKMAAVGAVVGGAVGGGAESGTVAGAVGGAVAGVAVVGAVAGAAVGGAVGTVGGAVAEVAGAALGGCVGGTAAGATAGTLGGAVVGGVTSGTFAGVADGALSGALDGAAAGVVAGTAVAGATLGAVGGCFVGSAAAATLDGVLDGIIAGAAVGAVSGGAAGAAGVSGVAKAFDGATD